MAAGRRDVLIQAEGTSGVVRNREDCRDFGSRVLPRCGKWPDNGNSHVRRYLLAQFACLFNRAIEKQRAR